MRRISAEQQFTISKAIPQLKSLFVMCQVLTLINLLMAQGCAKATDADSVRQRELAAVLTALLKTPPPPTDPDESSIEKPGWYDAANRQALRDFIAKDPDSEEAYLAEVWLVFAQANTEINRPIPLSRSERADRAKVRERIISDRLERKLKWADLAEILERIISRTTQPGTAKIARILRTGYLLQANEWAEFQKQADEILAHIKEYKSENDEQFLRFMKVIKTPPSEEEPTLRQMLVISECHQHHLDRALALAKELKQAFPRWRQREIDGNIHMLELGRSPFPTWEDMMDRGRSASNNWPRLAPAN